MPNDRPADADKTGEGPFRIDCGRDTDGDLFVMCGPVVVESFIWEKKDSEEKAGLMVKALNAAILSWLKSSGWVGPEENRKQFAAFLEAQKERDAWKALHTASSFQFNRLAAVHEELIARAARMEEVLKKFSMWPCECAARDTDTRPEECVHCISASLLAISPTPSVPGE